MKRDVNSDKTPTGYHYYVTDEQVREHRKRSVAEIFEWLHNANVFMNAFQTEKEKELARKLRAGEI
ncbi:MAG: hypothetical protein JNL63_08910 [Bacteroidia bacterium]|nr:hypothetical protein [Bacteroidia bacterium]